MTNKMSLEAFFDHGGRRRPTAVLVPPRLHRACNNQPRPSAVVSVWGEAWQIALGCRYGSQRMPWGGSCCKEGILKRFCNDDTMM